jgi:signal transduction histidine kinase
MKSEFFALVSHELRTPLTSIMGYLDLLEEAEGPKLKERGKKSVDVMRRNSKRLYALIDEVLLLNQVDAGGFTVSPRPMDLQELAAACVEEARPKAVAGGIKLNFEAFTSPEVLGDPDRLAEVIGNLLSNALKFTPRRGSVTVRVGKDGSNAAVEVEDTGTGIPAEEQSHLFDRFYRGAQARHQQVPGAGLGLAIVKTIVEAHGGSISATSVEGEGSKFHVELPLAATNGHGAQALEPSRASG